MEKQKRILYIGAHPDDADFFIGGTAIQMARAGHAVKFVSLCNGDCGHYAQDRVSLAARRYREAQAAAKLAGICEYQVLDNHDCEIVCSLPMREAVLRIIRNFQPGLVVSHRNCDYHADHRATAQLVMDCAYLVTVPLYCADTPIPEKNPVFACSYDPFRNPSPFRADAAVETDSVMDLKFRLLDCHYSQYYEWLPWNEGLRNFDAAGMEWAERKNFLEHFTGQSLRDATEAGREALSAVLGADRAKHVQYAEAFEYSEYGAHVTREEFRELFIP